MNDKKTYRRYYLVAKKQEYFREFMFESEVKEFVSSIEKFNKDEKQDTFLSDVHCSSEQIDVLRVLFSRYKKLREPSSLKEIDDITINYQNEYDFKVQNDLRFSNELRLAYHTNKLIYTLPLLYSDMKDLLNPNTLLVKSRELAIDNYFVRSIFHDDAIKKDPYIYPFLEKFKEQYGEYIEYGYLMRLESACDEFIRAYLVGRNKELNYTNLRKLAFKVKEAQDLLDKTKEEKLKFKY